jgi:hypothetical protein
VERALHKLIAAWEQNLEPRAKERALNKVPHRQSSPIGRGEEVILIHRESGRGSSNLTPNPVP